MRVRNLLLKALNPQPSTLNPQLQTLNRVQVRDLFLKADADGSGSVDNVELAMTLNSYLKASITPRQAQQMLYLINRGKVSLTLNDVLVASQQLGNNKANFARAFQKYDHDGSGTIDR